MTALLRQNQLSAADIERPGILSPTCVTEASGNGLHLDPHAHPVRVACMQSDLSRHSVEPVIRHAAWCRAVIGGVGGPCPTTMGTKYAMALIS